ncbi:MAG: short-chain dehydrogenase/reductase [Eubacterium sp.]|nr:short-chain dehydrogenase/reductase [Eubacterium sp.]
MLIEKEPALEGSLKGKTVLITGAGGGIGFEAAKAFAYMGARIVIAEVDKNKGKQAEQFINDLFCGNITEFYEIDLADKLQIDKMSDYILSKYDCPYIVFNNATYTKMGSVDEVSSEFWDKSYAVNFRAPLILTQNFLPKMKEQNNGIIVFVSSSGASPYMGTYEVFKTAQVELSNTLAMELEGTNVYTYTIGPGLVKTETAMGAIEIVAAKMGMTTEEFYKMNDQHILDAESAGAGFALSTRKAALYNGQEIGSIQVLMDFNLMENDERQPDTAQLTESAYQELIMYFEKILQTYMEQYKGWKAMNIFEKQWVLRDFKKVMALSAEQACEKLKLLNNEIQSGNHNIIFEEKAFFEKLKEYWKHQLKLLQGYEKNPKKLEENTLVIEDWIMDIEKVLGYKSCY